MGVGRQCSPAGSRPRGKRLAGGRTRHKAWQYQAASMQHGLVAQAGDLQPGIRGRAGVRGSDPCAWGLLRSSSHGAEPLLLGQPCSPAEEGQTRQAGPRAVKEKNIPRPANCCSQLFPPPPAGGEKKSSASSGGGCKRMQNFNHLLHQPGLRLQSLPELCSGTTGKGHGTIWGSLRLEHARRGYDFG